MCGLVGCSSVRIGSWSIDPNLEEPSVELVTRRHKLWFREFSNTRSSQFIEVTNSSRARPMAAYPTTAVQCSLTLRKMPRDSLKYSMSLRWAAHCRWSSTKALSVTDQDLTQFTMALSASAPGRPSLLEKPVRIGAKLVTYGRQVILPMAGSLCQATF